MLMSVNIPSTDSKRTKIFYNYLLKDELQINPGDEHSLSFPIAAKTCALTMFPRRAHEETTTCFFEVGNLEEAIAALESLGGNIVVKPFAIHTPKISRTAAILKDPDGNAVGVVSKR